MHAQPPHPTPSTTPIACPQGCRLGDACRFAHVPSGGGHAPAGAKRQAPPGHLNGGDQKLFRFG